MMHLDVEEGSVLILKGVKDLGWTPEDQNFIFDPSHISDVPDTKSYVGAKQRSHPYAAEKCNYTGDLPQSNQHWEFATKQQCVTMVITVNCIKYMYIFVKYTLYVVKICTVWLIRSLIAGKMYICYIMHVTFA